MKFLNAWTYGALIGLGFCGVLAVMAIRDAPHRQAREARKSQETTAYYASKDRHEATMKAAMASTGRPEWARVGDDISFDQKSIKDHGHGIQSVVVSGKGQVYPFFVHCPTWRFRTGMDQTWERIGDGTVGQEIADAICPAQG